MDPIKENYMLENGGNDESVILIYIYLAHDLKFHSKDPKKFERHYYRCLCIQFASLTWCWNVVDEN